jgi:hypothetical protein
VAVGPLLFFGRSANSPAVVGQDRVDLVRDGRDQLFEERAGGHHRGASDQADEDELARAVDGDEQVKLSFGGADFGRIDMEVANGVSLERLPGRLVALDFRQSADAVALETAVQRRAGQVRDRGLKRVEAVVQGQKRVTPEGDGDRLVVSREVVVP